MQRLTTPHGELTVSGVVETYDNGTPRSCRPDEEAVLRTPVGTFTPQYTTDDLRRRTVQPMSFHPDGGIRSLSLERTSIVLTPAGPIPAELVTFHVNGGVNRVFPLNGRLSGFWSEEDEAGLAEPVVLETPLGVKSLKLISVSFWPSGAIRSLTLWPDEVLAVPTPVGDIPTRMGVCWHENGAIASVEPAEPVAVETPVGPVRAFDPDAVGINGDTNSLCFNEQGALTGIATVHTRVTVSQQGAEQEFRPAMRESLCGDTDAEPEPLRMEFTLSTATFIPTPKTEPVIVDLSEAAFHTGSALRLFDGPLVKTCSM